MIFKEYKPGDRIMVPNRIAAKLDEKNEEKEKLEEVEVIKQYPHHVMVQNKRGMRWCVTNGELYAIECERAREEKKGTRKPQRNRKAGHYA